MVMSGFSAPDQANPDIDPLEGLLSNWCLSSK